MSALTNLAYTEFDTTQQTLVSDLLDKILLSSSWSKISSTTAVAATTALSAATATTLTFTSGVPAANFSIGQVIRIGEKGASDCEYRTVTAIAATTLTVAALTFSHSSGTNVYVGNEVLKCTTTGGADMIVDLMDAHVLMSTTTNLNMAVYKAHSGSVGGGTDRSARYLYWRSTAAGAASNVIHAIVSVSKEHIFIQLEGPRYSETNPDSATLGSAKNTFFMGAINPYFVGDTVPSVFAGGQVIQALAATFPTSLFGHVNRDQGNAHSWVQARLPTLAIPANGLAGSVQLQHIANGDDDYYLWPYVVVEDADGMRGRLLTFFHVGFLNPDFLDTAVSAPPIGAVTAYDGQNYKLLATNKTGTNVSCYQQWGSLSNPSNSPNNLIIAVPCT